MEIIFLPDANDDLSFWVRTGNRAIIKKITQLVEDIKQNPFDGIGKPEQLKHHLAGYWSRRINHEHRLIYEITENKILIHSAKGHYE